MRNRLIFLAGVGVGYLLGARAGRERYDQIMRGARRVRENPTVQEAAGVIQAQAGGLVTTARDVVSDKIGHTTMGSKVTRFMGRQDQETDLPFSGAAGSNGVPARLDP